jgi:hypothetical protein
VRGFLQEALFEEIGARGEAVELVAETGGGDYGASAVELGLAEDVCQDRDVEVMGRDGQEAGAWRGNFVQALEDGGGVVLVAARVQGEGDVDALRADAARGAECAGEGRRQLLDEIKADAERDDLDRFHRNP